MVEVEIPIDESIRINDANVSTTEYMQLNQSPTSSQTITTIASINRPDDNESTSLTLHSDKYIPSLIKLNETAKESRITIAGVHQNVDAIKCHKNNKKVHHKDITLNCNNSSSNRSSCSNNIENGSSSSRCTSFTDRLNNCNEIFDHHQNYHQLNKASKIDNVEECERNIECKNVNISNMTELNKALMSNSHVSTFPRSTQTRASFLDRDRCEMGIR